ncbi:MAG TPA: methylenetetrahydrofolate reductase [Gammaproteobacteria bacterium]|nr:methylenetetrahydrofolate reductase [Gammaproteobacteria bacterium]
MPASKLEHEILMHDLREAYMEIFPANGIEEKLRVLEPNSYVAVTCSPTKGIGETLDLSERLIERGFRVIPHIAAKCVRDRQHVTEIVERLDRMQVDSIFVPGGDRSEPAGEFHTAYDLLKVIDEYDHNIREIGIAAHPEGHPDIDDASLMTELARKQPLAQYIVTQMCFDADLLGSWLVELTRRGITLPVWIGLPGAIERSQLLKTSLRIGVGDSMRFLRKRANIAAELMKSSVYKPDELVMQIARYQSMPETNVAGFHLFCFNQVESTAIWRNEAIESLA